MRQLIPSTVSRRQFVKGSAAAATIGSARAWPHRVCRRQRRDQDRAGRLRRTRHGRRLRCARETKRTATSGSSPWRMRSPSRSSAHPRTSRTSSTTRSMCRRAAASWVLMPMRKPSRRARTSFCSALLRVSAPRSSPRRSRRAKHAFLEKPVAVDAPGYRAVKSANEEAKKKGLYVAVGHNSTACQEPR